MQRAPTSAPLSMMQGIVADLLGLGLRVEDVAVQLSIGVKGVRFHVNEAAKKIASDLPAQQRVIAWARGASADVLLGITLKAEVQHRVNQNGRSHSTRVDQLTGRP